MKLAVSMLVSFAVLAGPAPTLAGKNLLANGDFHLWDSYPGHGVTTTSTGVPAGSIPNEWYGGPGVGATATYDVVKLAEPEADGKISRFLRIAWSQAPSQDWPGETHHQPAFRFTFLEYFGIHGLEPLAGKTARFRFYGRAEGNPCDVVPILWHSYDASTPGIAGVKGKGYELFESSGKAGEVAVAQGTPRPAAVCHLTDRWQRFERLITLPTLEGRSITAGNYTGTGFDLVARCAPTIDIANVEVCPMDVGPDGAG